MLKVAIFMRVSYLCALPRCQPPFDVFRDIAHDTPFSVMSHTDMARERETSNLPIAGLIAVALAIGGVWLYQSPLHSSRPSPESGAETRLTHDPVLARLWEDPFAAVDEHREK